MKLETPPQDKLEKMRRENPTRHYAYTCMLGMTEGFCEKHVKLVLRELMVVAALAFESEVGPELAVAELLKLTGTVMRDLPEQPQTFMLTTDVEVLAEAQQAVADGADVTVSRLDTNLKPTIN